MTNTNPILQWFARWMARAQAVKDLVSTAMLVMTGLSTGLITLQQYGHGQYAWPLIAIVMLGVLLFTYAYAEFGIYNQQHRDHADFGKNYADPRMKINDELVGCAVFAALHGRPPSDDEQAIIEEAVDTPWHEYRDGIEL